MKAFFMIPAATAMLAAGIFSGAQTLPSPMKVRSSLEGCPEGRDLNYHDIVSGALRAKLPVRSFEKDASFDWEAVSEEGSLYLVSGDSSVRRTVALSEAPGIVYGETVSRNEFGINGGIFWSPDRSRLAFYRKDETRVTLFPLLNISGRTGSLKETRYPMNGMTSERISLGIYDLEDSTTRYIDVHGFGEEDYLTCVSWAPDSRRIYVQVLDRAQHNMRLNMYDAASGTFLRTLLEESDERWVEPQTPLHFLDCGTFIYTTDCRDGFKNLYLADTLGGIRPLTTVAADVEYLADNGRSVFYTSAEVVPEENHLFRIDLRPGRTLTSWKIGRPVRLTAEEGWHNVVMDSSCSKFYDKFSSFTCPGALLLKDAANGRVLDTVAVASDPRSGFRTGEAFFGTVKSADGLYDNAFRLFLPVNFDPSKRYPLVVYVYGGPHSQMVSNRYLGGIRPWEMMLAEKGYVVYVQDNRGTLRHGSSYEKAINRRCGVAEMEDQMVGINALRSLPWVDSSRVGVCGWSYGGFMTISLMTHYPSVFKAGTCGGPVIDWKWYEVMYGERYMDTPETNPDGFAETSLLSRVDSLRGHRLLILQGGLDNTVLCEHSLSFVMECIRRGVQVEYFPYPLSEHNVGGPWREHMYEKGTLFFEENL